MTLMYQLTRFELYKIKIKEKMATVYNSKFINIMFRSTGVNHNKRLMEDLNLTQILKPAQVEALTASVVKVRKALCSSGEGAGLEHLKGQKEEEDRLEIKPCSPRLQWTAQCSTLDAWQVSMLQKDVKITEEWREEEEVKKGGKGSRGTMSLGINSQVLNT